MRPSVPNHVATPHDPPTVVSGMLHRLKGVAASRGLTLLSPHWSGARSDYHFVCQRGHTFTRRAIVMMRGKATCLDCVKDGVRQRFFDTLRQKGFTCHEEGFLGLKAKHHLSCHQGHRWEVQARKIMEGSGCAACATERRTAQLTLKEGIERLQQAAATHGGCCVDVVYRGMAAQYQWECAQGHRWQARGQGIVDGGWCGRCWAKRYGEARRAPEDLAHLKAMAASKGGVCLDDVYTVLEATYQFRCTKGHVWKACGHRVMAGTWCRRCANDGKMNTIEAMHAAAYERGGRCLSDIYQGTKVKLRWTCHQGHVWQATPENVIHGGAWCPNCFRLRVTRNVHRRRRYEAGHGD